MEKEFLTGYHPGSPAGGSKWRQSVWKRATGSSSQLQSQDRLLSKHTSKVWLSLCPETLEEDRLISCYLSMLQRASISRKEATRVHWPGCYLWCRCLRLQSRDAPWVPLVLWDYNNQNHLPPPSTVQTADRNTFWSAVALAWLLVLQLQPEATCYS